MLPILVALSVASGAPPAAPSPAPAPSAAPAEPVPPTAEPEHAHVALERMSVAVLDLRASKGAEGIAKALTTLVTTELGARDGYRTVSRGELMSLLAHQADQRLLGCDEPQCVADIGKLVQAQRVVFGGVQLAEGGVAVLSLTLVDPEGPTILERVAYSWHGTDASALDDMIDLARPAVDRLVLGKRADELHGAIELLAPPGAHVVVDDADLGQTPLEGPVRKLAIGPHRVEVRKFGFVPWGRDVAVHNGETQVVQVDLVDETSLQPWWARWYVWGSALAGVVVIGGTAAGIATYQYLSTPTKLVVGSPQ